MGDFNAPLVGVEVQATISNTALLLADISGISADDVSEATRLWLVVNNGSIRFFYGGATPTTTEGNVLLSGRDLLLPGNTALANFKLIRNGTVDAEVVITLEE